MKRRCWERAQATVEFALVLPILLLILMGIFDFGRGLFAFTVVANSAREGARVGIIQGDDAAIRTAVRQYAIGVGTIPDSSILITRAGSAPNQTVKVQVSYDFDAVTPVIDKFLPGGKITLTSAATMVVE